MLEADIKVLVTHFFNDDEISRIMPGRKDYITVTENGRKEQVQKRMLLHTLRELYQQFKLKYPNKCIGATRFAMYRPKNCVLLGSPGSHVVCVCMIHQNVKLLIHNAKLAFLSDNELIHYNDFISLVLCEVPTSNCYFGNCKACPGITDLKIYLETFFADKKVEDDIEYKQWTSTDRCDLITFQKSPLDFINFFAMKIKSLIPHTFIVAQQAKFIQQLKTTMQPGEFLISCDFAENFAFVIQDEAQGYHWNNEQATIHPFVGYYREDNELKNFSYIIISDCKEHNSVAVKLFITKLINYMKLKYATINKLYYISDGAASQYKNKKNFSTVYEHKNDFGIACEWHFHATSHGKGPCDGIGGTLKRKARRESLARAFENQITSPRLLYNWAISAGFHMDFDYSTVGEYMQLKKTLDPQFKSTGTIKGTQQFHSVIPCAEDGKLQFKKFSLDNEYEIHQVYYGGKMNRKQ